MSKITIIEPNTNDKDQTRNYLVKGEKGYSAYELYVRNGGTMTEAQWLDAFLSAENYYSKSETDDLLDAKVNTSDIKDNLTSTDTNKPLSAKQGKELKGLIDTKADSSDVYTKTQSDNKYLLQDNILVLSSDSAVVPAGEALFIDTGDFNGENSVIISANIDDIPEPELDVVYDYERDLVTFVRYRYNYSLGGSGNNGYITIDSFDDFDSQISYKIVLLKIS